MPTPTNQEETMLCHVSGLGISAIGVPGSAGLIWVMNRIIQKGGIPKIEMLIEEGGQDELQADSRDLGVLDGSLEHQGNR